MFNKLLLAVDVLDPAGAERVAQAASLMAKSLGKPLHILNVVPDSGMAIVSASLSADHSAHLLEDAKAALEAWAKEAIPADVDTHLHITNGTVYDQIIKTANDLEIDAIYVGAHSPELRDYLIGPNAARVARHATQSVFVIR